MPVVVVTCPLDGEPLEVWLGFQGEPPVFHLATSPRFVEHMNGQHGRTMLPVEVWPPASAE